MKKTMFPYFFVLIPLLGIMACVFDSDNEGVSTLLDHEGLPSNYKVEVLTISDIEPSSAISHLDEYPYSGGLRAVLGTSFDLNHDLFLDIAFKDEDFFSGYSSDDSARGQLEFYLNKNFYSSKELTYKDSLPMKEELTLSYSWVLNTGSGKEFVDSIGSIYDTTWYRSVNSWDNEVFDTVYSVKIENFDSLVIFRIPEALVKAMQEVENACRLQLKISAKESGRLYRLNGSLSGQPPVLRLKGSNGTLTSVSPFRMAIKSSFINEGDYSKVLHGGGLRESLVIELPKEKIMSALSSFYGDEFPYVEGDSIDVRQLVVLAEIKIPLVEDQSKNTLNKPIQMVVRSNIDSLGENILKKEVYKINSDLVKEQGHPNMVFNGSDTLSLQITYGMRDFINRASRQDDFRFVIHLDFPVLRPNDPLYSNYINEDGDSIRFNFSHFDYVHYDLAPSLEQSMNLKLWLATKRGEGK